MLGETVSKYGYLAVDDCCNFLQDFGHLGVPELCLFEISWGDLRGGVVEESLFGCASDVLLLADHHCKWPPAHHVGLLFLIWCKVKLCCCCYPVLDEAIGQVWVI